VTEGPAIFRILKQHHRYLAVVADLEPSRVLPRQAIARRDQVAATDVILARRLLKNRLAQGRPYLLLTRGGAPMGQRRSDARGSDRALKRSLKFCSPRGA